MIAAREIDWLILEVAEFLYFVKGRRVSLQYLVVLGSHLLYVFRSAFCSPY